MRVLFGKLAATPKRRPGRPLLPPDLDLMGALYALVDKLETGWPLIGWELERIRNTRKLPSLGAIRKALRPIKDWSQNYVFSSLISSLARPRKRPPRPDQLRQLRNERGQAYSTARAAGTAVEEQAKFCQEAAAALKEAARRRAKPIVQVAKAKHDAELNRLQERFRKVNEKSDKLSKKLLAQEAFFTQSQALGFLRSKRYKLTPRNLSAALAGSPYIRWRASILRCQEIGCKMAVSSNYLVFLYF